MLRIKKLRAQLLSSWLRSTHHVISSLVLSSRERYICRPTVFAMSYGSRPASRLIYQGHVASQTQFFSATAGTILVQARDPARLSFDIQNAVDEHRYEDAWKFLEQHLEMEGFPRKSIVNKLLVGYAETSGSKLLERAVGLVEQAFEKDTLMYLALVLARCSQPGCLHLLSCGS